ncbi:MAG: Spy/CpxP family protein refolding chaperone [Candidatus Obscuribacterales bacterium]|jgi:Spy/CpxP family protein refolding chaperone|nr:Spy/CpxP family protein refolding chaperone [Candidatus Obscuribacterales bacterium]
MRWFSGFGGGKLFQKLELSDEQVEKISELKEESFAKFAHGKIDGMQLHQQLFKELSKEKIDREKVLSLGKQLKDHKAQMTDLLVHNMLAFAEVLTSEQRKKLKGIGMKQFWHGRCGEQEHWPAGSYEHGGHESAEHRHCGHGHRHEYHEHHEHHEQHEGSECSHQLDEEHDDDMEGPPPPPPPPPPPRRGGPGFGRRH